MSILESIAPFDTYATAIAQDLIGLFGINVTVRNLDRLPTSGEPLIVVCNHRSFLDPFLLTSFLSTPIDFVCHRYMGNVPVLREILQTCGGFPLTNDEWHADLLQQSAELLERGKTIGIFPEGAAPMLEPPAPTEIFPFHRGVAHLALQTQAQNVRILPVAIRTRSEINLPAVPLSVLHRFDPLEPLFAGDGWHPAVIYQQADIRLGTPFSIATYRDRYHGRQAARVVKDLTATLSQQVAALLAD
jgi:1-acyl-sn-glycerol-3-phosphate acyltransferase